MAEIPKTLGRYEIAERVGRGAMGVVYRGRDPVLDREVAIKLMHADFSDDENARPRFFREARAAAKLQHRNIVTIFEFNEEDDVPYIAMEFLRGQSLSARVTTPPPLTLVEKLDVVDQLCTGLSFAHSQGVVHRDVKPANVWIQDDGAVKLLDFGIAKVSSSTMTGGSDVMGSAPYMAPEQLEGKHVDGRADIFSAGVVLYELLSGSKPFPGDSPTAVMMQIVSGEPIPIGELVADIPAPLAAVVNRALQKSPDKRYAKAEELAADLRLIRRSLQASADVDSGWLSDLSEAGTIPPPPAHGKTTDTWAAHAGDSSTTHYEPLVEEQAPRPAKAARSGLASVLASRRGVVAATGVLVVLIVVTGLWFKFGPPPPIPVSDVTKKAGDAGPLKPPPPEPARTVRLTSDPAGAAIVLDGKDAGVTPATVTLASGAPGELRLTRRGYAGFVGKVSAEQAKNGTANYRLDPSGSVKLVATGPYAFQIVEGRTILKPAEMRQEITLQGRHTVRLVAPEYFLNMPVTLDPTVQALYNVPVPELGTLTVSLQGNWQSCRVQLDGRDLGESLRDVPVAPGSHEVTVSCIESGQRRSQPVSIQEGLATKVKIE